MFKLLITCRCSLTKSLDDIFDECADYMHEIMKKNEAKYSQVVDPEQTADVLGVSSVMTQDKR